MASHISLMTWSRPRATLVPSVTFSRSWPSLLTAAMRRLVPAEIDSDGEIRHAGEDYQNCRGAGALLIDDW